MLIAVRQIDPTQLAQFVQLASSGASFSGNFVNLVSNGVYMGPNVVWTTGGSQSILGVKTFVSSPIVPYSGGSGAAPSALWVNDQLGSYSGWAANTYLLPATLTASGAALYGLIINMSGALTGQGGSPLPPGIVYTTGDQTVGGTKTFSIGPIIPSALGGAATSAVNLNDLLLVSGSLTGAGGGGASSVKVTGSANIASPNFTGVGSVFLTYDGTLIYVSGSGNGGGGTTNNYYITGTGVVSALSTGVVNNTFNITSGNAAVSSSGTVNNVFNGTVNNTTNIGTLTGNFVNMSFYFDQYTLTTGLEQIESYVGRTFTFTGYAVGAITSGTQGFFSGSLYQRTPTNTKVPFAAISLNNGLFMRAAGGFAQTISGLNRVGLDILSIGTGFTGVSIGVFGIGF